MRAFIMICQVAMLLSWTVFQLNGGLLTREGFLLFSGFMAAGSISCGYECFRDGAKGTALVQAYFTIWTFYGVFVRW